VSFASNRRSDRRFGHAVERKAFPEAAKELDQIRHIVAINLVLGLLTVSVGASDPSFGKCGASS
jgi:uncharacterized membrane protein